MKASELRIGNLVNYKIVDKLDERKKWFEPCEIDAVDLQVIDSDYQPIPLTEEWLLKFGFKYSLRLDDFMFKDKNDIFEIQSYKKGFLNLVLWHDNEILQELKYVHQLQNLYFALTNEELTLIK